MNKNIIERRRVLELIKERVISSEEGISLIRRQDFKETDDDIAIIGMSGRFPMADNLDEFWENLKNGKDCTSEIPSDRWDVNKYYDPDPSKAKEGKMYCKWGGFLRDVDKFDPLFFNLSPLEAEVIDPQERIFIQTVWEALEDSGWTRESLRDSIFKNNEKDVGVFAGVTTNSYLLWGPEEWAKGNYVIPTTFPWAVANRVSYLFNFKGPSMPIDTACSSSLTAIHYACESLKNNECSVAVVGGVNLYLHPIKYVWLCKMTMLSKKGKCHSFGIDADGFCPAEGVSAIILKPLKKAIKDGDNIHGIIKATSINQDGKTTGFTVPSPIAQSELILDSLKKSSINPRSISYVEAHGTGTALGDPIEINGLQRAYSEYTGDKQFCAIGSLKSNIGHGESVAGIAGLVKVLLQMKHKQLVPSIHSEVENPKINFMDSPFYIQKKLETWEKPTYTDGGSLKTFPRRASVSSFGAGGVNAHVIIEEYERAEKPMLEDSNCLFVFSARDSERLNEYIARMIKFIEKNNKTLSIRDFAYTLINGREFMDARVAFKANNIEQLIDKLKAVKSDSDSHDIYKGSVKKHKKDIKSFTPSKEELSEIINKKDYDKIASLWVKGVEIDQEKISILVKGKRISLPTYPFAKEVCWYDSVEDNIKETKPISNQLHPLIDENISTLKEECFKKTLNNNEFYLSDHVVKDKNIFPGVAYLEMVYHAYKLGTGAVPYSISNVVWLRPIDVTSENKVVNILLRPLENYVGYEIISYSGSDRIVHGQGKVKEENTNTKNSVVDISAILGRCKHKINKEECYTIYKNVGLQYGPAFRCIEELKYSESEVIAKIMLPKNMRDESINLTMHPSIMDCALQSIIGFLKNDFTKTGNPYLPFSIGELIVNQKLNNDCYAYTVYSSSSSEKMKKFDVTITDLEGNVLVLIKDFALRIFDKDKVSGSKITRALNLDEILIELKRGTISIDEAEEMIGTLN